MLKKVCTTLIVVGITVGAGSNARVRAQAAGVRFVQWPIFYAIGSGVRVDQVGDPGTASPAGTVWATTRQDDPRLIRLAPGSDPEHDAATWTAWTLSPGDQPAGEQNAAGIAIAANDQVFVRTKAGLQRIDPVTNLRTVWPDGPSNSDVALGAGTSVFTALPLGPVERLVPDGPSLPDATVTRWNIGGSGEIALAGIAVNPASGLVYFSDNGGDLIGELDPMTSQVRRWSTGAFGVTRPRNLSIDRAGDVWVVSRTNHIVRLKPSTGELTVFSLPSAGDPYGVSADGVVGFTELALGRIGLLIPTGSPVVVAPSVSYAIATVFRVFGEIAEAAPVTGTSSPVVTDVPATASGSEAGGYFIEAPIPGSFGPLGIDRNLTDLPGTFYYADTSSRLIGRASLPVPQDALVTGGGWIDVPGGRANFSFTTFRKDPGGPIKGTFRYKNFATGETIQSLEITDLLVYGTNAVFSGTATIGNGSATFTVQVSDNGEPSTNDAFRLTTTPGTTVSNTLAGGNIQIHRQD